MVNFAMVNFALSTFEVDTERKIMNAIDLPAQFSLDTTRYKLHQDAAYVSFMCWINTTAVVTVIFISIIFVQRDDICIMYLLWYYNLFPAFQL